MRRFARRTTGCWPVPATAVVAHAQIGHENVLVFMKPKGKSHG
jgi:hypothetical protein